MKWYSIVGLVIAIVSLLGGIIIADIFGGSELLANVMAWGQLGWIPPFVEEMKEERNGMWMKK